mgnify:CR=1 FL=1
MRRNMKKTKNKDDELNMKIIKYSGIGIAILAVIVLGLLVYSKNLNDEVKDGVLTGKQVNEIINDINSSENTESASTEIGKSVNKAETELKENNTTNTTNTVNSTNSNTLTTNKVVTNNTASQTNSKVDKEEDKNKTEEKSVELNFEKPVEGDIVKSFAIDSLVYSDTLQEWTTHTGVDIKAEKTTVVKAAESGTVKTIKNDPRYGLTVIIEHANGFQTVYSNLLTSEFVVEGEKVKKGQSIGTVGNTAAFEIADEPHLHFEVLKDFTQVDPNIYLK